MNQSQCVPSWELDDVPPIPPATRSNTSRSLSTAVSAGLDISTLDYEVAELAWENGHLTKHGLGIPRVSSKPSLVSAWDDKILPRALGTLESIVNQATANPDHPPNSFHRACDKDYDSVPWVDPSSSTQPTSMSMDALVPIDTNNEDNALKMAGACASTRMGSCSAAAARVPVGSEWSVSQARSNTRDSLKRKADDTCQLGNATYTYGMTSTSFGASFENTKTAFTGDDHDSVCHSRPQRERGDEEENQKSGTTKSVSTKRSRAAAIHNQSERKRRDKINQRMKALQKLVPSSSKSDKASMLDEVIDYMKQLQAQVQMMSRMSMPSMMLPMAMQQQLQMSMMSQMGMGMMGLDPMNMGINAMGGRSNIAGITPSNVLNPSAFMTMPAWDGVSGVAGDHRLVPHAPMVAPDPLAAYMACQQQPIALDAYTRMAAMYQQVQQQNQQQHNQQQTLPTNPSPKT